VEVMQTDEELAGTRFCQATRKVQGEE